MAKIHPSVRAKMVRAMEYIVRAVNDEWVAETWLMYGVADGDIDGTETDEDLDIYYEDDEDFAELMDLFLRTMVGAKQSGGLYVDGVVSEKPKN